MLTAKEARRQADAIKRTELTSAIVKFKAALDGQLKTAAEGGLHSASVKVPKEIDEATLKQMTTSLLKLGYTTQVEERYGFLAVNLYIEPKRMLKLFW
jgi:hypothetical protein